MKIYIGELLVKKGLIDEKDLENALLLQKVEGKKIGEILIDLGLVTKEDILKALSEQFAIPIFDLDNASIEESVIRTLPLSIVKRFSVIPVRQERNRITLAISDPTRIFNIKELQMLTGFDFVPVLTTDEAIEKAIAKYYESSHVGDFKKFMKDFSIKEEENFEVLHDEEEKEVDRLELDANLPPVVKIVNHLFTEAVRVNASDMHIEPGTDGVRVRYRVDGMLYEVVKLPVKYKDGVTTRIKVLSNMDISEKRLPQDGRVKIQMKVNGKNKELDIRVSSTPTLFGEKIVMRILDKSNLVTDLGRLGLEPESYRILEDAIFRPWGMILVTGPTGSGKTNTLYSAIGKINIPEVNIMTVEDPVEFNIPGINQVQIQEGIGLTFASALRSFLRQDPNVILVGEIRDTETAQIAVKASLTGHLVFSTLHTNDAPSTIFRLVDMGIDRYLVATSLVLIVAQRLVRRLCPFCREETDVSREALVNIGFSKEEAQTVKIYRPKGCEKCNNRGYKGRIGLFEVMKITESIRDMILSGAHAFEIRKKAKEEGMITLRESGLIKIKDGITTIEEVIRETLV
ncbi:MAG: type IV-A pilus assembly ATPase PilB [Syntrophorhabdaceae bacterium]|nr:type IV-A pilus assembly ATPase PilB [Syntrophorhabdaceae bacterium]